MQRDEAKAALLKQQTALMKQRDAIQASLSASTQALECLMTGSINAQEAQESAETIDNLRYLLASGADGMNIAFQANDEKIRLKNIHETYLNNKARVVGDHPNFQRAMKSVQE